MVYGGKRSHQRVHCGLSQQAAQTRRSYCTILLSEAFQWEFTDVRGTASMCRPLSETAPLVASSCI